MDEGETSRLEFPIPLDSVVSVTLNVENLRVVLEFLLGVVRKHDSKLVKLQQDQDDLAEPQYAEKEASVSEHDATAEKETPAIEKPALEQSVEPQIAPTLPSHAPMHVPHPFNPARLKRRIKKRKNEIKAENVRNSQQDQQIAALSEAIQSLKNLVDQQARRVETVEDVIGDHQKAVRDHELRLSALEARKPETVTNTVIVKEKEESTPKEQSPAPRTERRDDSVLIGRIEELENKAEGVDKRLAEYGAKAAEVKVLIKTVADSVDKVESDTQRLSESVAAMGSQVRAVNEEMKDIASDQRKLVETQQELQTAQEATDRVLKDLESRLSELEKSHKATDDRSVENKEGIDMLRKLIRQLEEQMRDKADADTLDMLKNVIISMNKGGGAAAMSLMPTKDSNLLHDINRKVAVLEDTLAHMGGSGLSGSKMTELIDRLDAAEKLLKSRASAEDVEMMLGLIKRHRADMDQLEQVVRELEERPSHVLSSDSMPSEAAAKVDSTRLIRLARRVDSLEESVKAINIPDASDLNKLSTEAKRLWEAVEDLKAAIEKLRKEMQARQRELEDLLSRKADIFSIQELERKG